MKKFNLFEQKENYKILGTNESYWSWDDDSVSIIAYILLYENTNELYLKIRKIHTKHGLGAGNYEKDLEFIKIGTIFKSDLKLVRSLLKKHAHQKSSTGHGFSIHWKDEEGNKMSLTDLIKLNQPNKPEKQLKYIKTPIEFKPSKEKKDIELVQYSDRSYALFGEGTKDIKEQLKSLGCRYNRFLTDPSTGQKRAGWICSIGKLDKVKQLL